MRVLMLSSLWPPAVVGGAEIYAATLARELQDRGHVVGVVTLGVRDVDGAELVGTVRPWPVRVDRLRAGAAWRRPLFHLADAWRVDVLPVLRDAVERFRPDVVHSHVTQGMSVAALTAPHRLGVPHVHTLHDYWLRCWRSTMTRRNGGECGPACRVVSAQRLRAVRRRPADVVVAISQAMLDRHPGVRGRRNTVVLRHPIETADIRERPANGHAVFGYLGQLNPNKGVDVLLDAARRGGHRLVVAGRGRLEHSVRTDRAVDYRGWVAGAEREKFFDAIDCLVVPSVWAEPAGLAVNEAVARGLPVIAAASGGLPEYVPEPCRPLLTPPGDPVALARSMTAFATDPVSFRPGRPDATRSWPAHIDDIIGTYDVARGLS